VLGFSPYFCLAALIVISSLFHLTLEFSSPFQINVSPGFKLFNWFRSVSSCDSASWRFFAKFKVWIALNVSKNS